MNKSKLEMKNIKFYKTMCLRGLILGGILLLGLGGAFAQATQLCEGCTFVGV
jgi:hypothetical protein